MNFIEEIKSNETILAIVIKNNIEDPIRFISPPNFPFQVGIQNREKGEHAKPHEHKPYQSINIQYQEFFYVINGKIEVEIYHNKKLFTKVIIRNGESILLNSGHGINFLEKTKLIEVKQGPYRKDEKIFI